MVMCAVCKKSVEHQEAAFVWCYGKGVPVNAFYRICMDCDFQDVTENSWKNYSLEVK